MFVFKLTVTFLRRTSHSVNCRRFFGNKVRVRFAPSPTGYLHLGGLRTALYNHLFAKAQNGVTILRIEDTDLSRKIPSAAENLVDDLAWCGITYDEGPYFQSDRWEIYQKYVNQLVEQGDAYYCFCTNIRLEVIRKEALKAGRVPKYDNHCRHLTKEEVENFQKEGKPYCVRFKLSTFRDSFNDLIWGPCTYDVAAQEGDPVILKNDGLPTYHLANVVDDHLMKITHVLRGVEWLASTTKHILLYRAFKWDPPDYGHIPLLLNEDGTKLSKRQGDIQVRNFREKGYLPNGVINFIIHFGGGFDIKPGKEVKIYTIEELVGMFDLSKVKNSSCKTDLSLLPVYNHAEILNQLETKHGRRNLVKKTQEIVRNYFEVSKHKDSLQLDEKRVEFILTSLRNRIPTLEILVSEHFRYLWVSENNWNETNERYREIIKDLAAKVKTVSWNVDDMSKFLKKWAKQNPDIKYVDIMQAIRVILTGNKEGHGVAEIITTLSREDVLSRLSKALEQETGNVHD